MRPFDRTNERARGQSEVLGVALLIGIAVVAAVATAATGFAALDRDRERVGTERAEQALSQFDSRSSEVALGRSDGARVDFGLPNGEGTMSVRPDAGWMRVDVRDLTGVRDPNSVTVTNVTLGAVVYEQDGRTVGYQGGGLFRATGNRSVLVSRPEFHYRNGTLTVPVIQTGGDSAAVRDVQVTPNGTVREFPNPSRNLTNRVDNTVVTVTVQSEYYRAWAEFFRAYTPGIVEVDPAAEIARVQFISLPDTTGVVGGVVATAESGDLGLLGTGAYVDTYNSSEGSYSSTQSSDGVVKAVGNINISADATIDSTARSGDDIRIKQSDSELTGDANHTDEFVNDGILGGDNYSIDGVPTILPIDSLVRSRLNEIRRSNNNSVANAEPGVDLSDGRLDVGKNEEVELDSGRYYMETMQVSGGTLVLNTTGGNVSLAVRDWIRVTKSGGVGGNVTVKGNGTVKVYLTSQTETRVSFTGSGNAPTRDLNLFVGKGSTVYVPGDVAPRFRVFAPQDTDTAIAGSSGGDNNATFHGLVYAPDGLTLSGSVFVKQSEVFGGVVAGKVILGQYGQVHFDESLKTIPLPRASRISRLEYMHVTVHRMNVTRA